MSGNLPNSKFLADLHKNSAELELAVGCELASRECRGGLTGDSKSTSQIDKEEANIRLLQYQQYAEYAQIFFWILKDYAWAANAYFMGVVFGTAAVVWAVVLVLFSFYRRDYEDMFVTVVMTLWLGGNYVWMSGELTKDPLGLGIPYWGNNAQNTAIALDCFIIALSMMTIILFVLIPLEILPPSITSVELERREDLLPRFPCIFQTFRQYEYVHVFFWIGKDVSWNLLSPIPWSIFFFFTFAIGLDTIILSYPSTKQGKVVHMISQLIWVFGNFAWGFGDQFNINEGNETGRRFCQLALILALLPLIVFYTAHLLSLMCANRIQAGSFHSWICKSENVACKEYENL